MTQSILILISICFVGFKAASFIGGRDITDDRKAMSSCRAVVGTPGRLLHLISNNVLCMDHIKLFVLDEADKLLQGNFQSDVKKLIRHLPSRKVQMLASSATFSDDTSTILQSLMKNPIGVTPSRDAPILLGVKQCTYIMDDDEEWQSADKHTISIRAMTAKVDAMKDIFARIAFKQAIIFSNSQMRAESYGQYLQQAGWKADVISGSYEQSVRLDTFQRFRAFETRILVATDLMARGIDVENIDLVINLDVPAESATYLHRIGRCGRFGSHGTAITIIGNAHELHKFNRMLSQIGGEQLNVGDFRAAKYLDVVNGNAEDIQPTSIDAAISAGTTNGHNSNGDANEPLQSMTNGSSKIKKYTRNSLDVQSKNLQLLKLAQLMIDSDNSNVIQSDLKSDLFESFNCHANGEQTKGMDNVCKANGNFNPNGVQMDLDLFGSYKADMAMKTRTYSVPQPLNNNDDDHDSIEDEVKNEVDDQLNGNDVDGHINDIDDDDEEREEGECTESDNESSLSLRSSSSASEDNDNEEISLPPSKNQANGTNAPFLEALKSLSINGNGRARQSSSGSDEDTEQASSSDSDESDESNESVELPRQRHRRSRTPRNDVHTAMWHQHTEPFAKWSAIYWNQVNQIQQYANFVRQQQLSNYFN